MKLLVLTFLNTVILIPGLIIRFLPFKDIYQKNQKTILAFIHSILLIVDAVLFYLAGMDGEISLTFIKLNILILGMCSTGFCILLIKSRWKEHLFTFGLSMLEEYCMITIVAYTIHLIKNMTSIDIYLIGSIMYFIIFMATFYFWNKLLTLSVTPFLVIDSGNFWNSRWFISVAMFMTCYMAMPGEAHEETLFHLISRLFMLSGAIFVCLNISRSPAVITALKEMQQRIMIQEEYYNHLTEQVEKDRKLRHDIKHHIMAIKEFIRKDDNKGLSLYCDRLLERSGFDNVVIPYTGNAVVDGIVYHYSLQAKEYKIDFDYPPVYKDAVIDDMDFGVLLGNALDNAIAGCLTVEQDRFIRITTESDEFCMRMMISNSFDGKIDEKNGVILSRKRNQEPGIGIHSMRGICEKNGAEMDIRYDDKVFQILFCFMK